MLDESLPRSVVNTYGALDMKLYQFVFCDIFCYAILHETIWSCVMWCDISRIQNFLKLAWFSVGSIWIHLGRVATPARRQEFHNGSGPAVDQQQRDSIGVLKTQ